MWLRLKWNVIFVPFRVFSLPTLSVETEWSTAGSGNLENFGNHCPNDQSIKPDLSQAFEFSCDIKRMMCEVAKRFELIGWGIVTAYRTDRGWMKGKIWRSVYYAVHYGSVFIWKEHVKWRGVAVDEQITRLGRIFFFANARHHFYSWVFRTIRKWFK
jgi:hypothetical protein